MKKYFISLVLLLVCSSAFAQINVEAAATKAFLSIFLSGFFSLVIFKLITIGLTRKNIDTPTKAGRWFGAWLVVLNFISFPSHNKSNEEFYIEIIFMAFVWFLIGFTIGFLYRKIKPFQLDSKNNDDSNNLFQDSLAGNNISNGLKQNNQSVVHYSKKEIQEEKSTNTISKIIVLIVALTSVALAINLNSKKEPKIDLINSKNTSNLATDNNISNNSYSEIDTERKSRLTEANIFLNSQNIVHKKENDKWVYYGCFDFDKAKMLKITNFEINTFLSKITDFRLDEALKEGYKQIEVTEFFKTIVPNCLSNSVREINYVQGKLNIEKINNGLTKITDLTDSEFYDVGIINSALENRQLINNGKKTLQDLSEQDIKQLEAVEKIFKFN